ncbi:nitric oxide reductase transcription regulator, partial [Ralstonia solanacearum]
MIDRLLLADLVADLPPAVRMQRLVGSLRSHFRCGAVALLRLEEDHLRPIAVDGLVRDALGRRFVVGQHPRLATILARRGVTCFHHDSTLPDPYDGLIDEQAGAPLPVHDCMGVSLHVEGQLWGALTLDTLKIGTFDADAQAELRQLAVVIEAAARTTRLGGDVRALRA